ncbi:hypothetical protein EE612_036562 [Oryza sativa]|nr:hypothetical protein EE612_036562 [Oryza sativa]
MAPPCSISSASHLLITASLPKPSLRPPRLPHPKPLPAALLALAAAAPRSPPSPTCPRHPPPRPRMSRY